METDEFTQVKKRLASLRDVTIIGCKSKHLTPSNITRESLVFDVSIFEACENLVIRHCCAKQIKGLSALKGSLKILDVDGSIPSFRALFNLTNVVVEQEPPWAALSRLNVTNAKIATIDDSIKAFPNLENLNLHGNALADTANLGNLLRLTILDLSQNSLVNNANLTVGNISILNLADNEISTLKPLSRLLGLVTLNLNNNKITDVDEVLHLDKLPMLQSVDLSYNPICADADYRSQVLGRFPNRIHDIILDGIIPSTDELAMAKVISALRMAKISTKENKSGAGRSFNLQTDFIL